MGANVEHANMLRVYSAQFIQQYAFSIMLSVYFVGLIHACIRSNDVFQSRRTTGKYQL